MKNLLKLKEQYRNKKNVYVVCMEVYISANLRNRIIRKFSTHQEKSAYLLHLAERKNYPLKLRAARGLALVGVNDDLHTNAYKLERSWKHSSKRSKQWYRQKDETLV